ncbi:MAG: hypothetical protein QXG39_07420 [Candidatus Aenigmatarchaeota archaeon]
MNDLKNLIRKVKKAKDKASMVKALDELLTKVKEENEMLRLQVIAREKERDEYKRELDEIHKSISYRLARWVAETWIGGKIKKFLWKCMKIK